MWNICFALSHIEVKNEFGKVWGVRCPAGFSIIHCGERCLKKGGYNFFLVKRILPRTFYLCLQNSFYFLLVFRPERSLSKETDFKFWISCQTLWMRSYTINRVYSTGKQKTNRKKWRILNIKTCFLNDISLRIISFFYQNSCHFLNAMQLMVILFLFKPFSLLTKYNRFSLFLFVISNTFFLLKMNWNSMFFLHT